MRPGYCNGKAHKPEHLGYGGRRVLVSRKWSGKTLADHKHDRRAWVLSMLGVDPDDPAQTQRYTWQYVGTDDPDVPARGDRLEAAWVVMLMLGTRPGETFGLAWDAIDWDAGVVEIKTSLRRDQATNTVSVAETKTARSRRRLDAPKLVLDALRKRGRDQAAERLAAGKAWTDTGLVFTNEVGDPLDPSAVRRRFKRVAKNAGLDDRHPHECRHSVVSMLSAQGVPLEQISDVLGHDGSRTTEQVYRHVITPSIASGKAPIEAIFGSQSESE